MTNRIHFVSALLAAGIATVDIRAADFEQTLKPLFSETCLQCHSESDANGDISFESLTKQEFLKAPERTLKILKAVDTGAMPPEGEALLDDAVRNRAVAALKELIKEADNGPDKQEPLQRLNRFQYNNTVRDLFQLNRDVFPLPEKLMTRYDDYLKNTARNAAFTLPQEVHVASHSLKPLPGLEGVKPFPKDLRAEHGYDNQADQLTLSPLLLDSFLRLSVSIVESPDFNAQTVGIWDSFFAEPKDESDLPTEIRRRLTGFLTMAFRSPVDDSTVQRYTDYVLGKREQGLSFTDAMRKVAAAALSSPMFLYRLPDTEQKGHQYVLASKLSYFLWGSCPDRELLRLAGQQTLSNAEVLNATISRMLTDPKIERFLDAFPVQWMQLENLMASTPDPKLHQYFYVDRETPASLQMVLEPLLLFDAVFLENRPLVELIAPQFGYQSEFLQEWYHGSLRPPEIDRTAILETNRQRDQQRLELQQKLDGLNAKLTGLTTPIRTRLLKERATKSDSAVVDLKPYAVWEFDGDLKESVRGLDLTAHGEITFRDGMVHLDKSYLITKPLPIDLTAKSLEVRFQLQNLDQRGGGLMGILRGKGFFDTIVLGERKNRHWISGSNGFSRTNDFPGSFEETVTNKPLHLLMVYESDGTTKLYRNGVPYGESYQKGKAKFDRDKSSVVFGLRHLPPGGNRHLTVTIGSARLYDRALTADEASVAAEGTNYIPTEVLLAAMTDEQRVEWNELTQAIDQTQNKLVQIPENIDLNEITRQTREQYEQKLRQQLHSKTFHRTLRTDPRYGGIITNSAMLSMTSGPKRTHPVARGVWVTEVIFNDPPSPPPNDVPPLDEEAGDKNLTIRERFAAHRDNPSCSGCHTKLDPLGFALENFDITGRWRDNYSNGRKVDSAGILLRKQAFTNIVEFKASLVRHQDRFVRSFTEHLLRYATGRKPKPSDVLTVDEILRRCSKNDVITIQAIVREITNVALAADPS